MKRLITESQLRNIIAESIKKGLNEYCPYSKNSPYSPWTNNHMPSIEQRRQTRDAFNKEVEDAGGPSAYYEKRRERLKNSTNPIMENDTEEQINVPSNNNQEYYTPEQAKAMGYRSDDYQDSRKPYSIWVKGNKTIKVKYWMPQKRSKTADWDGSEYSYSNSSVNLKESHIREIVVESINKVLGNNAINDITKKNNDDILRISKNKDFRRICKEHFGTKPEEMDRNTLSQARSIYYDWLIKRDSPHTLAETVNKSLNEMATVTPHKWIEGGYEENEVDGEGFDVSEWISNGNAFHPYQQNVTYRGEWVGIILIDGRLGNRHRFGAPDVDYGIGDDNFGEMKWFNNAQEFEDYVVANYEEILSLRKSGWDWD